jgi:endogenous inhibitor of DNA gyrase (YacG/DUF329 family)
MPQVNCKICGKEFYVKPSHQRHGWGKYCSRECQHKGQLKGEFISCAICQKKIWLFKISMASLIWYYGMRQAQKKL